jgi:hypothetical protein
MDEAKGDGRGERDPFHLLRPRHFPEQSAAKRDPSRHRRRPEHDLSDR